MTRIISVGIQKGGVGKSTTASVLAASLSKYYRVLAVDMDGQGNLTQLLTGSDNIFEFDGTTVYDAILQEDASNYILRINDNLHILCGDENVNTLARHFYVELKGDFHYTLKKALTKVATNYDYIIIDNPPALGELSVISLTASDSVLIVFETSKWCYNSLKSYLQTIEAVQERVNHNLDIIGILRSMTDNRRSDNKHYSKLVKDEYGKMCMDTIITRSAVVGRIPALGLTEDNPELKKVIKEYKPFMKEFLSKCQVLKTV